MHRKEPKESVSPRLLRKEGNGFLAIPEIAADDQDLNTISWTFLQEDPTNSKPTAHSETTGPIPPKANQTFSYVLTEKDLGTWYSVETNGVKKREFAKTSEVTLKDLTPGTTITEAFPAILFPKGVKIEDLRNLKTFPLREVEFVVKAYTKLAEGVESEILPFFQPNERGKVAKMLGESQNSLKATQESLPQSPVLNLLGVVYRDEEVHVYCYTSEMMPRVYRDILVKNGASFYVHRLGRNLIDMDNDKTTLCLLKNFEKMLPTNAK